MGELPAQGARKTSGSGAAKAFRRPGVLLAFSGPSVQGRVVVLIPARDAQPISSSVLPLVSGTHLRMNGTARVAKIA